MKTALGDIEIVSRLGADERTLAFDVLDGLTRPFKELPPKHFYDARGCELFDRITELPEYYPTRAERARQTRHRMLDSARTLFVTDGYPATTMERIAEAAVAVYVQGPEEQLRRRHASAAECARANMLATELALDLGVGLAPVFRHHMRQTVARQRVIQEGVSRRELARLAIGFVDLVGSTTLQAGLDPRALAEQVRRFESRAFDVIVGGGGRLVKFIGDEIMFAAVDPAAGVRIVADLVAAFSDDGTQPRGGLVFGEVLFRHGDYYGPMVNLAARLVDAAIPGETLVDGSVVAQAGEDATFEPAGRRMLKGFDEPVAVWSLVTAR